MNNAGADESTNGSLEVDGDNDELSNLFSDLSVQDLLSKLIESSRRDIVSTQPQETHLPEEPVLSSFDLEGVAKYISDGNAKNIIVMCGAGISVSAGIPDFRTPGTGLYDNLQKYNLKRPEDIFEIGFFKANPKPFFQLAKELFPGQYTPTPTHHFIRLLHQKGLLLRCYSQNIDSLETQAGLPEDVLVAAHGNFDGVHCISCRARYPITFFKEAIDSDSLCYCKKCKNLVKPNIVFFGEDLPERFSTLMREDFPKCDLLLVMGTSLVVHPFAGLIGKVQGRVPRFLINLEAVGTNMGSASLKYKSPDSNYRDAVYFGYSDDAVIALAEFLGWSADLEGLLERNKQASL
ncbi:hypothetical protein CEUSTIGMA_g5966.t1 [Chlamydomonas eustigma]|uniref:NAD-dependent protein deacetylase n=1 Tax=Chlamydomonas eustigma TaxID=1157962 RepID=A0A250X655_9CHLO|nr:hypothetical protein CEUSTIGMA_g5966.t1 [Chlamydomonas eustigma]|eukprot:GAX78526.1 hypothetical protein CEUSTIGMA_g5966.t1 [Chlamydomonas eustigma]